MALCTNSKGVVFLQVVAQKLAALTIDILVFGLGLRCEAIAVSIRKL